MRILPFSRKRTDKTTPGKIVSILQDRQVDLVVDVGANVGQTGQSLRQAGYDGHILSFEPVPSAHAMLTAAAAADNRWRVAERMAIGDADGDIDINVSDSTDMSSALDASDDLLRTLPKTQSTERVTVPMRRLDSVLPDWIGDARRIFLKIDTQGFERNVLNGATETLQRITGLQMELSLFPLYRGEETYLSFLNDLHAMGMTPLMLVETNFSRTLKRQLQIDVVFAWPEQGAQT
ncbi:MAG: FkbM family methyltransferase [Proteobacteria bacterium]|nr:FkbM family methyltransferase [Pseudomonadota bacterium]